MKNKVIILTAIIFFMGMFFIVDVEGFEDLSYCVSIKNMRSINHEEFEDIKGNRMNSKYDLVDIKYNDSKIPYDKDNDIYYFSTKEDYAFDIYYDRQTTVKKISSNNDLQIIAYNKHKYKIYNIKLITSPIANINLNNKSNDKNNLVLDKKTNGYISIWNNNNIEIKDRLVKLKVRGNSSQLFEKKSYTLNFIDDSGNDLITTGVLGMKADSKYALNSMYEDNSRIRDVIGLKTWNEINDNDNDGLSIEYVEVFINDNYYGLYALHQIITENSLNANNDSDIIYKINANTLPKLSDFETEQNNIGDTEIVFCGKNIKDKWEPMKNMIELVYYSDDEKFKKEILNYIDLEREVNYFTLLELMYAKDNRWKNSIFIYEGNKVNRMAWDLDGIFGMVWDFTKPLYTSYDSALSTKLLCELDNQTLPTYLEKRLWENNVGNFRQKVAKRWQELRGGFLETESFINYANSLYDEVTESGAREREHERWPEGGYSTDNSFMETFIRQRLPYLDEQFLKYLDDSGEN